jgi:predicted ferric reductase
VVLSLWRKRFGLAYEWWRLSHGLLAFVVVFIGIVHVIQVSWFTDPWWKRGVMLVVAGVAVLLLVHTRLVKPWILTRHPYVVSEVRKERADSWTLVVDAVGHQGMGFEAGQYAWLTLGDSPFSLQQHPFSFASSATDPKRLEFTAKVAGDFTATWPDVGPGTGVFLEGPYGAFTPRWDSPLGSVFVAGGIGITPVMSILRTLAARHDDRPCLLLYANRNWDEVVYREELTELEEKLSLRVVHVLEEAPEGWEGETGFVDSQVLDRHLPRPFDGQFYYVCGPEPMMDMVEKDLVGRDIPLPMIMSERFEIV